MKDYALTTVIIVAFCCMGMVSIIGALFVPTNKVACEVQIPSSDNVKHVWVGTGEML